MGLPNLCSYNEIRDGGLLWEKPLTSEGKGQSKNLRKLSLRGGGGKKGGILFKYRYQVKRQEKLAAKERD